MGTGLGIRLRRQIATGVASSGGEESQPRRSMAAIWIGGFACALEADEVCVGEKSVDLERFSAPHYQRGSPRRPRGPPGRRRPGRAPTPTASGRWSPTPRRRRPCGPLTRARRASSGAGGVGRSAWSARVRGPDGRARPPFQLWGRSVPRSRILTSGSARRPAGDGADTAVQPPTRLDRAGRPLIRPSVCQAPNHQWPAPERAILLAQKAAVGLVRDARSG
jgi:hypothetical protein